ncbi:MAG: DUF1800 family protein, partial [Pyrinomonadaceae bacterium]
MSPRIPALVQRLAPMMAIALLVVGAANLVKAQTLPTDAPILLSEIGSTRAFVPRLRTKQAPLAPVVVQPGDDSRVTLYAVNMELLKGEGATAFRAFVEDANRRQVYVTVESVKPTAEREWVYEIVLRLKGEIGNVGDVLVGVTWRGMISNRVRLAIGHAGGGPADDEGAFPTPMPAEAPIFTPTGDSTTDYVGRVISPDRVRFMEQATFGPTADLDVQIRRMGMSAWLADQMTMAYPSTAYPSLIDQPINVPVGCTGDCVRDNYSQHLMQRWFFTDALYGQAQLRRKVSWSLHKLLVISGAGGETQQPSWMLTYLKVLDRNAFGNFRTMLMDMTLNGGMGNYLDMIRSTKNNPNENYAREILQLFSVGLYNLNIKGEVQC